jgi:hypothetical protein
MSNIFGRTDKGFDIVRLIEEGADILISTVGADIRNEADLLIEFLISRVNFLNFFPKLLKLGYVLLR